MSAPSSEIAPLGFGPFQLFPQARLLKRDGKAIDIGGRALDLLIALASRPGVVVGKRDLIEHVWADTIVEDGSLRFHMNALRRLLGDGKAGARYISTQVGVGYAFVGSPRHLPVALAQDSRVAPDLLSSATPRASGNLPARNPLIGREQAAEQVLGSLERPTLLTIAGTAGIGKTMLAIEVGHRLADRDIWSHFIDLAQVKDKAMLPSAFAAALGFEALDDGMSAALDYLSTREGLVILDNCEHLIDAVAATVERLRDAAPDISIVATSREPLRACGEQIHWLAPLAYPRECAATSSSDLRAYPAMQLFLQCASAGNIGFTFDDTEIRLIADMCRRLEGLALPIELAAFRVATHGARATHALLGERMSLAWTGRRTALPRQQTIEATLDWSYNLLSPEERLAFERLSVFADAFSLDSAIATLTPDLEGAVAAIALDGLVIKGLVAIDRSDDSAFRLPELTRLYARHRKLLAGSDAVQPIAAPPVRRRPADTWRRTSGARPSVDRSLCTDTQ